MPERIAPVLPCLNRRNNRGRSGTRSSIVNLEVLGGPAVRTSSLNAPRGQILMEIKSQDIIHYRER